MSVPQQTKELSLKGKHCLTISEFSSEEIQFLIDKAVELKTNGNGQKPLSGKILGMIFEKNSTRTRVSFEAGMLQLGGQAIYMNSHDSQLGRGEPVSDTAKVLSHYVDAIMIRTYSHERIQELADHSDVPVINGLTDIAHPCQALADVLTLKEQKGTLKGLKLAYVGDGNNVANSLMVISAKLGIDFVIAAPKQYWPAEKVVNECKEIAKQTGSSLLVTEDVVAAVKDADAVYSDVWTSMGQEEENEQRLKDFSGYQVNEALVNHAKPDYIFMHCLPAHRGEEVSAEVIDGTNSVVFEQAGNRLHAQKALLVELLKD
ncbi:ornithine carbamoyltransferase [Bacillus sp. B15-48]|uniref:ornithine carbamoyltransferase n=1 Tax=Bacillus sp. B15-48 TaxID=1548601 RepID=UPI00194014C0|nr:ornithine carbamoyltransferase [Bacillus sp. B15-48]MBM4764234.1 ornithine carbamoyltransferase [Bacillus sp. B15-48]